LKFLETSLSGLYIIELEPIHDSRGFFARSFCASEFASHGLSKQVAQCNVSSNEKRGTLRGLHFQVAPHEEAKLVRCTQGSIFDVAVDIRTSSPTYLKWFSCELSQLNHQLLYIPEGFAHGFQTLHDNTEVSYTMFEFYHPESAHGLRWDDPALAISWPITDPIISDKDRSYPLLTRAEK
jgi:dTDP-4-dehydrorhamnose 3,5-epimerase